MRGVARITLTATLLALAVLPPGPALGQSSDRHVAEIAADIKAKYPQGVSESPLCQRAKGQHNPVIQFRPPDLAAMEKGLPALAQASDEVVLVGLEGPTVSVPISSEDVVAYTDVRVLRSWKGTHKVGDWITVGFPVGTIICGPHGELAGTVTGPGPRFVYHNRNPAYGPGGPYVLFLGHKGTPEIEGLRLAGGDGIQGMFDIRPVDAADEISDRHSIFSSCFRASYGGAACYAYDGRKASPDWCGDPQIDAQNIVKCNAALGTAAEPIVAYGVQQDPLREKYNGMAIAEFLEEVQNVANASNSAEDGAFK